MTDYSEVKSKYCDKCKNQKHCYKPCPLVNAASEHLFSVLKEALRHPAIDVRLKEDGTINLFFDGCCECDIQIKNYTDLRSENLYDS